MKAHVALTLLTALLVACDVFAYRLDLDLVNESGDDAVIHIIAGEDWEAMPPKADVLFTELVPARQSSELDLERPGPGGWSIVANRQIVTDSSQWPPDNPTIDLTIRIEADGTVVVEDT